MALYSDNPAVMMTKAAGQQKARRMWVRKAQAARGSAESAGANLQCSLYLLARSRYLGRRQLLPSRQTAAGGVAT